MFHSSAQLSCFVRISALHKWTLLQKSQGSSSWVAELLVLVIHSENREGSLTGWPSLWEHRAKRVSEAPDYDQRGSFNRQDQALHDANVVTDVFQGRKCGHYENQMEWLGRQWTMECFSWASLLTLQWSWPLSPAPTAFLEHTKPAKFLLMYSKLSLSTLTKSC